jgi:hypothetical protein
MHNKVSRLRSFHYYQHQSLLNSSGVKTFSPTQLPLLFRRKRFRSDLRFLKKNPTIVVLVNSRFRPYFVPGN